MDRKTKNIQDKLDRQMNKYLSKLQRQEDKLRKKIWSKDSSLAKQLFEGADEKYSELKNTTGVISKDVSVYSGHLDSLSTALNFLKANNLSSNSELLKSLSQYKELQSKFNASANIKKYLQQRQQLLKEQFEKLGMVNELKKFRKQVYYYQAQVKEYKEMFEDPSKIEKKLMEQVMKFPQFQEFFAKNSILGSMFSLPGNGSQTISLTGLQTRAMVNQYIVNAFGSGQNVNQILRQNIQAAQGQLSELKNKLNSLSNGNFGSGSDKDIPDFKPNNQKTKSFFNRLEYGINFQSQKANNYFPVTSDIGLSVGYKLNNKSVVGVGASYKLGWGKGWDNIRLSNQGLGLRSYVDYKLKGSLNISGGYEQNYKTAFSSIDQLRNYSSWQVSGLIGLSKKYKTAKKMKGEMKLLWDFLSYQQVPKSQPILFRVGYSLK